MIKTAITMSYLTITVLSVVLTLILVTKNEVKTEKKTIFTQESQLVLTKEESKLMGSWVEHVSDGKKEYQGFTLHADGTATSINTGKLLYKTWKIRGDQISLVVESAGKGSYSEDMETYAFEHKSKNTLLLKIGKSVFKYKRVFS